MRSDAVTCTAVWQSRLACGLKWVFYGAAVEYNFVILGRSGCCVRTLALLSWLSCLAFEEEYTLFWYIIWTAGSRALRPVAFS